MNVTILNIEMFDSIKLYRQIWNELHFHKDPLTEKNLFNLKKTEMKIRWWK